jgi:hypothetical protein
MLSYYLKTSIESFMGMSVNEVYGAIARSDQFDATRQQGKAWVEEITILKEALKGYSGTLFFEFSIPRMGKRVDVLVIVKSVIFVLEFKVGESNHHRYQIEQVWDYALDLKNFHKPSHKAVIAPILIATEAKSQSHRISTTSHGDHLLSPILTNTEMLSVAIKDVLAYANAPVPVSGDTYAEGAYFPTPTIVEAAVALYNSHSVDEIARSDAEAVNLTKTTSVISDIIEYARTNHKKAICFVTGVPGAGKTLVGLKVATMQLDTHQTSASVYLSGNAPLVAILQEALTRDKVKREREQGKTVSKVEAKQAIKSFIQIIHHYRDAYLISKEAPYDHVAIFDEAQRAWNKEQTVKFMRQKKNQPDFDYSEPEFLISCLDRHDDWAVVVCLVGGGQEINTGEAGISEWLNAIRDRFRSWEVFVSPNLKDSEYAAIGAIEALKKMAPVKFDDKLHLSVSMRSFRAENLSLFVKSLLDLETRLAKEILAKIEMKYPIVLTRDLESAKNWLREKARGSERYGIVVSSQAQRLRPLAIDVRPKINPVNWFLDGKEDVRSSYFLEDVATEFDIQGLELDWTCVTWDGDLRLVDGEWATFAFKGSKWQRILGEERKRYLINAYRVLLTRARQGMVIVVPQGDSRDHTRKAEYYDGTFEYLRGLGIQVLN